MADKPTSSQARTSTTFDKDKQPAVTATPSSSSSLTHLASSSSSSPSIFFPFARRFSNPPMASHSPTADQAHSSMAPPPPPIESKKFDITSLMSPPDAVLDSFHHGNSLLNKSGGANGKQSSAQQPLPMSPPISPYSKPISTTSSTLPATPHSQPIKDPVLYPTDEHSPASPPQPPLFAPAELEHQRIVDEHVRARSQSIFSGVTPPKREDYELVLTFRSQVMTHFTTNRKGWLRKERALLEADRRAGAQRYHAIMPAKPIAAKPPRSQRTDRISKPHATPRPIRTNATTVGTTPVRPVGRTSATPEPSRRVVAPNREDKDFNSLPDYCPPLNSLPNRSNSLKVDWKGQPIDLSSDPHASLLHPDELLLAGNLRLDCATYLTSKRRIFERRLQCLRTGKEFRKTDAQQACKIDVNKASKLWTAFEKVGWLEQGWVRRFL
ncbi:hypothetical protein MHUMG1_10202 [Metarhizium humberi]|uniref:SWIRM domain-containing protein n=1 Tax=Metarhizium humberi TaxID=2596975 RepID=A0A9P8S3A9_9HYPO|nr:hypothetical protein MHUMG1_10202 [Metarhizium humberi]